MNHRRLDAESIRDAILTASGQLDPTPRKQSIISEIGDANVGRNANLTRRINESNRHRSVYLPIVRNRLPEMLRLFDFAEPSIIVGRREVTTVPAQALFLLNSSFVIEQSDHMARRILAAADDPARCDRPTAWHWGESPPTPKLPLPRDWSATRSPACPAATTTANNSGRGPDSASP
ncbi:MAG: hypothetical protein Ct9H300mP1_16140 [Planctomycetaceae bacterium]|nr:MAG: hypothetical protein Ct9H300mP1_16140 [Planctomycetaceae bacterium]